MAKRAKASLDRIEQGSGNVFADLGLADPGERKTKLRLAYALNRLIEKEGLSQTAIAGRLSLTQPKVSALLNYKLHGFPPGVDAALPCIDCDVKIVVARSPNPGRHDFRGGVAHLPRAETPGASRAVAPASSARHAAKSTGRSFLTTCQSRS
jgi:predicted XRE-type DNA-binding protein